MILSDLGGSRPLALLPVLALALLLGLQGCTSQPERRAAPEPRLGKREQPADVQGLLVAAERATGANAAVYRLRAAGLAIEGEHFDDARRILAAIDVASLPSADLPKYIACRVRVALHEEAPDEALGWLASDLIQKEALSLTDQIELSLLRAEALRDSRRYLASAKERVYIDPLLPADKKPANHEQIWESLMELPVRTLFSEAERALTSDLRGWLSLTAISKQYQGSIDEQLAQLEKWRQLWPGHPAAELLPGRLSVLSKLVTQKPRRVALLLPLEGQLGPYGKAIRDGFLAANYDAIQHESSVPEIVAYDTSTGDVIDLYNQAMADGAEFVVGPLDRDKVERLSRVNQLPAPVLALNRAQQGEDHPEGLYQFGLAPEDEVLQVASQAWREGLRRAVLLVPDNEWGHRNATAFVEDWLKRGGEIAESRYFTTQNDYSDLVRALLSVDTSEKRAADLRRVIRESFEFDPRRRQDIDFIVLLANPSQARGINPTLAFFFAEDLPVYSTSHINDNSESRIDYVDLNGIRFCDIPWKLTSNDPLQQQIESIWSGASRLLAPFYALGVDAYHLYPRVRQFIAFPSDRLYGSTGVLRLDDHGVVTRQLMWAEIRDGQVVSIPMVLDAQDAAPRT